VSLGVGLGLAGEALARLGRPSVAQGGGEGLGGIGDLAEALGPQVDLGLPVALQGPS
jgi:hypothetical protein